MSEENIKDEDIEIEDVEDISADKIKKIKQQLKICQAERKENLDGWQRARADYLNLQKKTAEDKKGIIKLANADILKELMTLADNFDMAFKNKESWEELSDNWRQGIEMIHNRLKEIFAGHGMLEINPLGIEFNPNEHDAAGMIETTEKEKDHTIAEVLERGYSLNNKVIRPARVIIFNLKDK